MVANEVPKGQQTDFQEDKSLKTGSVKITKGLWDTGDCGVRTRKNDPVIEVVPYGERHC